MKKINFLVEKPSEEDLFEAQGHSKVANAIKDVIENKDYNINLIGIEGSLGGGKSTVVEILKSQLKNKGSEICYEFVEFDLDKHHDTSIKSAFVHVLHDEFCKIIGTDENADEVEEKLKNIRDTALGRTLDYTRKVKSNLSLWLLPFIITLPISVRYFPETLKATFSTIHQHLNNKYEFSFDATLEAIMGLSVFALLLIMYACSRCKNEKFWESLGGLVKRQSDDRINETLNISRTVGSIELKKAYSDYVKEIPEDMVIILVIDNIDRINKTAVREVWSDLDIFISVAALRIKIILPFSEKELLSVAKRDGGSNQITSEFITKRIPISFTVPPLITYDWRIKFEQYVRDAFPDHNIEESIVTKCADLLELWCKPSSSITPRVVKNHINEISSILLCHVDDEPQILSCSAYVLAMNYMLQRDIEFDWLLTKMGSFETSEVSKEIQDISSAITKTQNILRNKINDWDHQLLRIHYQTTLEIAQSENLISPIETAIAQGNAELILSLSSRYGFELYFNKKIEEMEFTHSVILAANVQKSDIKHANLFLDKWLPQINIQSEKQNLRINDAGLTEEYVQSVLKLKKEGREVSTKRLEITQNCIEQSLSKVISKADDPQKNKGISNRLDQLYICSKLKGVTPDVIKKPNPEFFVGYLWERREENDRWKIDTISLDDDFRYAVLTAEVSRDIESSDKNYNSLGEWNSKYRRLGDQSAQDIDLFPDDIGDYSLIQFSGLSDVRESSKIAKLLKLSSDKETDNSDQWTAILFAHLIAIQKLTNNINNGAGTNVSSWPFLKQYLDKYPSYIKWLPNYLTLIPEADLLFSHLNNEEHRKYLSKAITEIIISNRIYRLNINAVITRDYSSLKQTFQRDLGELLNWLSGWSEKLNTHFDKWNHEFLVDVLESNETSFYDVLQRNFEGSDDDNFWEKLVDNPEENSQTLVNYYIENKKKVRQSAKLSKALKAIFEGKTEQELDAYHNAEWFGSVISILPKTSVASLSMHFNGRLIETTTPTAERKCIIRNFAKIVAFTRFDNKHVQEIFITFIETVSEDEINKWIDTQNISFSSWSKNNKKILKENLENNTSLLMILKQIGE